MCSPGKHLTASVGLPQWSSSGGSRSRELQGENRVFTAGCTVIYLVPLSILAESGASLATRREHPSTVGVEV